jgi:gamma-glutamylputrescine oxidase
VKVDHAWAGTLAITMKRLPFIRRLRPGVYVASGYSGAGRRHRPLRRQGDRRPIGRRPALLDCFAALPVPPFPGGRLPPTQRWLPE